MITVDRPHAAVLIFKTKAPGEPRHDEHPAVQSPFILAPQDFKFLPTCQP